VENSTCALEFLGLAFGEVLCEGGGDGLDLD
jgi:hypothetical protein